MYQEGLGLYEKTSIMAGEQFLKLNKQDQDLLLILSDSKPIYELLRQSSNSDDNSIINFKTTKENNITYFTFDIVEAVGIKYHPEVLYKVNGSVIGSERRKNIVYTINKANSLYGTYVDNYTNINKNIILNEVTYINTRVNMSRTEYVELTVMDMSKQDERFIIDPNSDIYKLYCSKQIDITTLCNLALLQANNNSKVVKDEGFTKHLDKRFV